MPRKVSRLRQKVTVDHIKTTEVWKELKDAIDGGDEKKAELLLNHLIETMMLMKDDYLKTTIEIRKDILKEVRMYCARHNYTLKAFVNVALETMLNIGMPDETGD